MKRTDEQIFADSMDMELHRQATRAYTKGKSDKHWQRVCFVIERARTLVRQRMSEADQKATA